MIDEIKKQIARLDKDMGELWPEHTEGDHESAAKCAMQEIQRMRRLFEQILKKNEQTLFLYFWFYHDRSEELSEVNKYVITKTIENLAGDKLATFLALYEEPIRGDSLRWPICSKENEKTFDESAADQRLEI